MSQEFTDNEKKESEYIFKNVIEKKQATRTVALISFILSVASLLLCWVPGLGIILGAAAIVCAVISRINIGYFDGFAIAGVIIAIFGIVFSVTALIFKKLLIDLFVSLLL